MAEAALSLVFLGMQAFLWLAWWCVVRSRAPGLATAELMLCSTILYFAHIIGTSLILGWLGFLARGPLLLFTLVSGAGALAFALRSSTRHRALAGRRLRLPLGGGMIRSLNVALLVLFGVVFACTVIQGAIWAPSWTDDRKYHLPMSALMLQEHRLSLGPVHNPVIEAYPKDIEIWFHWILSFFRTDRWVDLAQLPYLFLAMVATYCTARRLGSRRATSLAGAMLLPFAPVILTQITTAYTDVAVSALVLSAVALLLIVRSHRSVTVAVAFGCVVGLLAGAKFSGVVFGGVFLAVFVVVSVRGDRAKCLRSVALVIAVSVLLGGDTYIRNWRVHGNPVFPFRVAHRALPIELPGIWGSEVVYGVAHTKDMHPVSRIMRSWAAVDVVRHTAIFGGFGVTWPLLAMISVISLGVSVRSRDTARLLVFALFLALFLATPLNFRVRFVIYLLGLGCVCLSHLLDRPAWPAPMRLLLIAAALSVAGFSTYQLWRTHYVLLFSNDPAVRATRGDPCATARPIYFRDAYQWIRTHAAAGSTVVVFQGSDEFFPYCVWNPTFSNRVEFGQAGSRTELIALASRRHNTLLFLPHSSAAYASYASDPETFQAVFAAEHVTIATLRTRAVSSAPGPF